MDLLADYFDYVGETECPMIFHRWSMLTGLGAYLGRQTNFRHGHFTINPNMYVMLLGISGTRKSTAIKLASRVLAAAGYDTFAANKTTKEKFLLDLAEGSSPEGGQSTMEQNLWGDDDDSLASSRPPAECFINADEFNDFFGNGNLEFASLLGSLWDHSGIYRSKVKNGASVVVNNPTISILGGNTPTNLACAFPPETLGQGFFSRLIMIFSEPSGKKITFPKAPLLEHTQEIADQLLAIRTSVHGEMHLSSIATHLIDKIYNTWTSVDDVRFDSYSTRRLGHLLKLCIIIAASKQQTTITEDTVIYANTTLAFAETFMPKALGEFGKAKNADVAHKVIQILENATDVIDAKQIYMQVSNDIDSPKALSELLGNLLTADKIQPVTGGFLIKRKQVAADTDGLVDYSLLTTEERRFVYV